MTTPRDLFTPHPLLTGGHRMTLYAWAVPRRFSTLPPPQARYFQVSPDTQVLGHCHWQGEPRRRVTVLLLHGLEGSSNSHYMRGMAEKAWRRGFNVVRLNQRNCGGTEHLTPGLYHSGLTADPLAVLRLLRDGDGFERFAVCGYSLGGNIALKLGGEIAGTIDAESVVAVAAVSPPIELGHCVDALERRANLAYHLNFLWGLTARMRRKAALFPDLYDTRPLAGVRSVRAFDDIYTAPHNGFTGAADYYHRASARRVMHQLAVPGLAITAEDDPFVPPDVMQDAALATIPMLTRVVTRHGGHCGFIGPETPGHDGYWAEARVIDFIAAHAGVAP
ncbi:MAG: alpha/beta fold hydrolase [Acidobacteria bacterium]|nr:alpha/beta fold hydrolase [Acidobacteriota bacterium]